MITILSSLIESPSVTIESRTDALARLEQISSSASRLGLNSLLCDVCLAMFDVSLPILHLSVSKSALMCMSKHLSKINANVPTVRYNVYLNLAKLEIQEDTLSRVCVVT